MALNGHALPPQYHHIETALEIFRVQNGTWAPDAARVAKIVAELGRQPLGANVDAAELDRLVGVADHGVADGTQAAAAAADLRTVAAIVANNANAVNAQNAVIVPAIATANTAQGKIEHLQAIPPQYAHVRDALIAFALQNGTWAPDAARVAKIVAELGRQPLGANVDAAELDRLVGVADNGVVDGTQAAAAAADLRTVAAIVANNANAVNAQNAVIVPAIATANTAQGKIEHLQAIPPQYAHVRDALIAFALQNGTWAPDAARVAKIVAELGRQPLGANVDAAELDRLVGVADNGVVDGTQAAAAAADLRTVAAIVANNANAVNAQNAVIVPAIATANTAQGKIEHLQAIPPQYAHVRDALIAFALQNGTWAPDAARVAKIVAELGRQPLGANVDAAELDRLVGVADNGVVDGTQAAAAAADLRTVAAIVANNANAVNAQNAVIVPAIATANTAQGKIEHLQAIPPQYAHVRDALIAFALQNGTWAPDAARVAKIVAELGRQPLGANVDAAELDRLVGVADNGVVDGTQAAAAAADLRTVAAIVANNANAVNAQNAVIVPAIATANTAQGKIEHLQAIPPQYAHVRDALIAFALQNGTWAPDAARVAKIVAELGRQPLGANVDAAELDRLVGVADNGVVDGTQAAAAAADLRTVAAIVANNANAVNAQNAVIVPAIATANTAQGKIEHLQAIPPQYAHVRDALIAFALQNGTWAPDAARVAKIVAELGRQPLGANVDAAELDRLVGVADNGVVDGTQAAAAAADLRTVAAIVANNANAVNAQNAVIVPAIATANTAQGKIEHLQAIPPQYAHVRDALIAFALQNGTWAPDAARVAKIVAELGRQPLGANVDAAELDRLVGVADNGVVDGTQAAAAAADLRTVAAIVANNANAVNAQNAVIVPAIATANTAQGKIEHLQAIPPQYAHVRDALIAFALQNGTWAPDAARVAKIVAELGRQPLGANVDAAELDRLVGVADNGVVDGTQAAAAAADLRTVAAIVANNANAVNAQNAVIVPAIATANTAQGKIEHLQAIPPQYAHVRDALIAFALQNGTWAPDAARVAKIVAELGRQPLGANVDAAELDRLVGVADNGVVDGTQAAAAAADLRTVAAIVANNANAVNAQNAVIVPAIATANTAQGKIEHLQAIPPQYAHVRDALIAFALQNGTWAPDAARVAKIVAELGRQPLGANVDAAELDRLVGVADHGVADGTQAAAAAADLRTVAAIVANNANAVNAQKAVIDAAILAASAAQRRIASIKTEINKLSACPATANPELMNVIGSLPSDIQQSLVDNNSEKLKTFLSAKSPHDVFVAARTCGLDSSHFPAAKTPGSAHALDGLWDEIQRNQKHLKLHNSKIAEVLAEQSITLDRDSIKKWNEIILNKAGTGPGCAAANFNAFVAALADTVTINKKPLTATQRRDLINALTAAQADIITQHNRNVHIIAALNAPVPPGVGSAETLRVLARIPKNNPLDGNDIIALTDAIKNAPTYEQFEKVVQAAAGTPLHTAIGKIPAWKTVLTPESFTAIKGQYNHEKLINKGSFDPEIKRQQAEIKKYRDALVAFTVADQETHEELERLTRIEALAWLNPDTESIARAHAIELSDQFEYLATVCDSMCRGLEAQRQAYQALADSFPEDDELQQLGWFSERGKVKKHRDDIKEDLAKIEEALGRYQLLHRRLYGDPTHDASSGTTIDNTIKKGILGVLQEAKQLKPVATPAKSSFGYQYEDFSDKKTLAQKLKDEYEEKPVHLAGALGVVAANPKDKGIFGNTGALKDNETRLHAKPTVAFVPDPTNPKKPTKGISACAYTEERGKEEVKSTPKGKETTQPVTMTVVQYPTAIGNLDPAQQEELKRAKVQFATEMAADLLARMGKLPTPEDPIVLRGSSEEQLGMLWTALVELGKAHPSYKFGADAIRVESMFFDPKGQKKWTGGYKDNSYFEQYFKGATGDPLRKMQQSIRNFYTEGFGTEEQQAQKQQTIKDITGFYKKALGDAQVKKGIDEVSQLAPKKP